MSGTQMVAILVLLAATLVAVVVTWLGAIEIEFGIAVVSTLATLGAWLTRK